MCPTFAVSYFKFLDGVCDDICSLTQIFGGVVV